MASKYSEKTGLPIGLGFWRKRDTIYVTLWLGGTKRTFCCGTSKPEEARKFREAKVAELQRESESRVGDDSGITCKVLIDRYLAHLETREENRGEYMTAIPESRGSYKVRSSVKHLERFHHLTPKAVSNDLLEKYVKDRRKDGATVVTVNREVGYLRAAMNLGVKDEKVNPLHVPHKWPIDHEAEELQARDSEITPEQYENLWEAAAFAPHFRAVLATVVFTGVRSKEIKFIRRAQVDFEGNVIHLRKGETKEGDARDVPINDYIKSVLLDWDKTTREKWPDTIWFFHYQGKQLKSWKTTWYATLKRAGYRTRRVDANGNPLFNSQGRALWDNQVRFHDSRRTALSEMDRADIDERDIQLTSGHKTKRMARRYNQSKAAVERVRKAQNAKLLEQAQQLQARQLPQASNPPAVHSPSVLKEELRQLKALYDEGLIPVDIYKAEIGKLMASHHTAIA